MMSDASARRSIAFIASSADRFCPFGGSCDPLALHFFFFSALVLLGFLGQTIVGSFISSDSSSTTSFRSICALVVSPFPLLDTAPSPDAVELAHMSCRSIQLGHTLSRYS
uniref:Uncharacterized protein n=1 Tax=Triticum urartu TaxID=4572 RepID=A0A8R7QM55_TRIUA